MQYKDENTQKLVKTFGEVVNEKREATGKSLRLFTNEYDLDSGNISRIENGKIEPKLVMMWRYAEALNIPLSALIKEVEDKLGKNFHIISQ